MFIFANSGDLEEMPPYAAFRLGLHCLPKYGKCSKISNTFPFLLSNKMSVFRAGIHKFLVRVANRKDPDQTASSEAVRSGSALFV